MSGPDDRAMSDRARVHVLAAEGSERCAVAHDAYARFMEEHGDPEAAEEHRRRSSASRSQAADHRRWASEADSEADAAGLVIDLRTPRATPPTATATTA